MTRNRLLALNYLLLIANSTPTFVSEAVALRGGFGAALNLFDVSAIVWLAIIACFALLWQSNDSAAASANDWVVTALIASVSLVPFPALSAAALSVVGLWGIFTAPTGSPMRRASIILLSLSTFFFWGRVVLALGAGPMLAADAQFVSSISGLPASGNVVTSVDGTQFVIAPGCSSLHGISLALVLWTTALAYFARPVTSRNLAFLGLAIVATIAVNGFRLAMIGWNPEHFDYWHIGDGAILFGWGALIAVTGVLYMGMRHDLRKA